MFQVAVVILNILFVVDKFNSAVAKGPHHPKGDFSARDKKLNEHLRAQDNHIEEDMKQFSFGGKELANMSDEEKNFYFFKLHDSDNNDHLDGLEILHAATHHNDGHVHRLEPSTDEDEPNDNSVIDVIDDFIAYADLDQNGLLTYPEYMKAISTNDWSKKVDVTESPPKMV